MPRPLNFRVKKIRQNIHPHQITCHLFVNKRNYIHVRALWYCIDSSCMMSKQKYFDPQDGRLSIVLNYLAQPVGEAVTLVHSDLVNLQQKLISVI